MCRLNELDDKIVGYIDEGFDSDFLLNTPLSVMEMDFIRHVILSRKPLSHRPPKKLIPQPTQTPTHLQVLFKIYFIFLTSPRPFGYGRGFSSVADG